MSEYALKNFGLKLEEIRKGKLPVDDYQMDISGFFPSYEEVECDNPYILSFSSLLFGNKEEKNPYELDLSNIINGNIQVKRQKNTYATILGRITDYENIVLDEIEDGTYLDYAAFLDLYKDVITEIKFAERLGIESNNYWRMKKGVFRTRANLNLKLKIRVKYLFSQSKFYEMDDFNDVCNKYGCSSRCCN